MKRILLIAWVLVAVLGEGTSQNDIDALRYSTTQVVGTARFMSMGGAFGSLGADFSTLSTNPAGIGLYKKSELSVSPAFFVGQTKSAYHGVNTDDHQYNFNVGNAGFIYASESKGEHSLFRHFQFGFGVNRINNFNNRMLIVGPNDQNSITHTYVDYANGIDYQDIEDDPYGDYAYDLNPAWWTYMIDTLPGYRDVYHAIVPGGSSITQHKEINSWGSMNELVLSLGTNLSDRLYIGGTFGFPFIRYFEEARYAEIDEDNSVGDFRELSRYDQLKTTGAGFNFKFGMILRVTNWLRLGGAVHTPTWYSNLEDEWYTEMSTTFDDGEVLVEQSPYGYYNYDLETPWRAQASASVILFSTAIISAEYEYVDYSEARLSAYDYSFYDENQNIRNKYTRTNNLRAGAEVRMGVFSLRAGAAYYMSPFADDLNDASKLCLSGGIGYRDKNFFLDLGYARSLSDPDYYLYQSPHVNTDPVKNTLITSNIMLTLGFRY